MPLFIATTGNAPSAGSTVTPAAAELRPAFEQVYDERFNDVLRWLRALGGIDADLEDLAQEVFVVVERRLSDFDGENLNAWLYKIAKNQVRDHRRRAWLRRLLTGTGKEIDPASMPVHARLMPTPLEELEHKESLQFVTRILDKMTVMQRSTFVLFEVEGYSGEEIAELEAVPVNTVWTRLHAARKTFFGHIAQARAQGKLP